MFSEEEIQLNRGILTLIRQKLADSNNAVDTLNFIIENLTSREMTILELELEISKHLNSREMTILQLELEIRKLELELEISKLKLNL